MRTVLSPARQSRATLQLAHAIAIKASGEVKNVEASVGQVDGRIDALDVEEIRANLSTLEARIGTLEER